MAISSPPAFIAPVPRECEGREPFISLRAGSATAAISSPLPFIARERSDRGNLISTDIHCEGAQRPRQSTRDAERSAEEN
jgi:hypothetical protein